VSLFSGFDPRDVFCREERLVVSRDHVIMFERHLYRIPREMLPRPRPGEGVTVRVWGKARISCTLRPAKGAFLLCRMRGHFYLGLTKSKKKLALYGIRC